MNNPREKLLEVAFNEIYQNGYTATSIDKILKQASMNKGSMYHFFKSKKELGLAVVNEKINAYIEDKYSVLLKFEKNFNIFSILFFINICGLLIPSLDI